MSTLRNRSERINDDDTEEDDYEEELEELEQDLVIQRRTTIKDRQNPLDSLSDRNFR